MTLMLLSACASREGIPESEAGESDASLRLEPARPTFGSTIHVEYAANQDLANSPLLRLRARYRAAHEGHTGKYGGRPHYTAVAVLERNEGGRFTGRITLPDSAVYALFAVEDSASSLIDTNAGLFWELLVHDERGQPLFDALLQQANEHMLSDAARMAKAGHRMVELYPDVSGSWTVLGAAESRTMPPDEWERQDKLIQREFRRLDRRLRRQDSVAADDMASLLWTAYVADDPAGEAYWRRRLYSEHPSSGWAVEFQVRDVYSKYREGDYAGYLGDLERLWTVAEEGPGVSSRWGYNARTVLVVQGLPAAVRSEDPETAERWAERYLTHARDRYPTGTVGSWLRRVPELRKRGLDLLRETIQQLDTVTPHERALDVTIEEQRRANERASARFLRSLGEELLEDGRINAAIDTLELAAARAWYPYLRRPLAEALVAAGDSARAMEAWAYVAAYGASPAFADTIRERIPTHFSAGRWEEAIDRARSRLHGLVLAESIDRPILGNLRVTNTDGAVRTLSEIRDGRPAVVVFWSRYCVPSVDAMRDVKRLDRKLEDLRVPLLAVTTDDRSDESAAFLRDNNITVPVYHDLNRTLTLAFRNAGTPQFYVMDESGVLRFHAGSEADEARVRVEALLSQRQ
jgi:thiol-disulfide isomerase/thioredoxin